MEHRLKTWPEYHQAIRHHTKNFELRKDDRSFKVGDVLYLEEFNPDNQAYTGNVERREVTYVLRDATAFGLKEGYCILGLTE